MLCRKLNIAVQIFDALTHSLWCTNMAKHKNNDTSPLYSLYRASTSKQLQEASRHPDTFGLGWGTQSCQRTQKISGKGKKDLVSWFATVINRSTVSLRLWGIQYTSSWTTAMDHPPPNLPGFFLWISSKEEALSRRVVQIFRSWFGFGDDSGDSEA